MATIDVMKGLEFEKFVAQCLRARGYRTKNIGASGDFGVDVVASKGRQKWAIQVKRYKSNVSRTAVSDAVAGKHYWKCDSAWVITNSYFTKDAKTLATHTECRLTDRDELRHWLYEQRQEERKLPHFWKVPRFSIIILVVITCSMIFLGPSDVGRSIRQHIRQSIGQLFGAKPATEDNSFELELSPQPANPSSPSSSSSSSPPLPEDAVPVLEPIPFSFDN